ncbi:MAG: hypothetical protein IPI67_10540 [Myxococcales bacterium]|nr:hypothetical protein [Myxococcales bacterium]
MSHYGVNQFFQAAQQQRAALQHELGVAQHYASVHHQRRAELGQAYAQATQDLGATLLQTLTPEWLDYAIRTTGFSALASENPLAMMDNERKQRSQRVAQIEADPRFAQRELLRHPNTGSLPRGVREMEENLGPLLEVLAACNHVRLQRLIESGYGTTAYSTGFWRMSYYEDWKAGDELLARFPGKTFFSQVRDEYLRAIQSVGPLQAEAARLRAEITAGEALEREHAECTQALGSLETRWLAHVRQRISGYMLESPPELLAPRLSAVPEAELAYKRALGVTAKARYLDQIFARDVEAFQRDAQTAIGKLDRDMTKLSRPKKAGTTFPAEAFQRRFRDRGPAYQKRWRRFEKTYGSVYGFSGYHQASLIDTFLWWDLMTNGRVDGDFIPEVRQFRQRNPDYRYVPQRRDDEDDLLAAAAAASAGDDGGDLSLDAS